MTNCSIEVLRKGLFQACGECPNWDERTQLLYCVDAGQGNVQHNRIHVINEAEPGKDRNFVFDGEPDAITSLCVLTSQENTLALCKKQAICLMDLQDASNSASSIVTANTTPPICSVETGRKTRFNDGKCDVKGRLIAGTMSLETDTPGVMYEDFAGSLYSIESGGNSQPGNVKVAQLDSGISLSNGIDFTMDNRTLFFADSTVGKIYAYDYDPELGTTTNKRTFYECDMKTEGLPDGMAMDQQDRLWVAFFSSSKIVCFDVGSATRVHQIVLPYPTVTSLCFGGPDFAQLYVTTAVLNQPRHVLDAHPDTAGALFKISNLPGNAKGRPMFKFQL